MKHKLFLTGKMGATVDVLLENMGRLSFGSNYSDFKGLLEPPILGQTILTHWLMFPLEVDKLVKWWFPPQLLKNSRPQIPSGPIFYSTTFSILDSGGDTFLFLPGWTKVLLMVVVGWGWGMMRQENHGRKGSRSCYSN
uniref:Galactosidase beta 1 like n=1 Tax=Molossus molossus TaxID=27622 RepID=A0A7J8FQZ8_MOLMO|nr:galactosidase beta 1 like [Molossus molossus]